ncbi:MAG: hypothetical protein D6677_04805 [Calditrichaeota bacterium]|nr:MAG: hypothetical protein D6677_04805 [Calditrichota bacterium]
MRGDETIVTALGPDEWQNAFESACRYALCSLPWTINRMDYRGENQYAMRVENIITGKLAEAVTRTFLIKKGLTVVPGAGQTPYWLADHYDLKIHTANGPEEWDVKTLHLRHLEETTPPDWEQAPALIPDRHRHDQWCRRLLCHDGDSRVRRYLFAFVLQKPVHVTWPAAATEAFRELMAGRERLERQDDFILRMLHDVQCRLRAPVWRLYLTAVAGPDEWQYFRPVPRETVFLQGALRTRIQNRGCLTRVLPSLSHVLDQL